jgi:hypothetical protein
MKSVQILLTMLFSVIVNSVYAYDFEVDGLYYNIVSAADKTCEVTTGDHEYSGNVEVPSSVQYNGRILSVISIGTAFKGCGNITSITIPNSVTTIGKGAFSECSSLASVIIPNSVTIIEAFVFSDCSSLASITIPNSVTSIGESAFERCHSLSSITIPNSVTSIGQYAFYCSSLASITIPNSVTSIGQKAFQYCSHLASITIQDGVTNIWEDAFPNCTNLLSVTIPNSVTSIEGGAFSNCTSLTSVDIPNSVTSIEGGAFYDCPLESITIPNSVTNIGSNAFGHFSYYKMKHLTIPSSVTNVDTNWYSGSFANCYPQDCTFGSNYIANSVRKDSIVRLTLMEDVTNFSDYAFREAEKLDTLVSLATTPPSINNVTENQKASLKVFVPKGTLAAYQAADVWKEFWNLQEGDGTTDISPLSSHSSCAKEIGRYTITGEKIDRQVPGINIVRMSDGTTRKVIIK